MRPAAFRRLFLYPFGQLDMLRGKRTKTVSAVGKNAAGLCCRALKHNCRKKTILSLRQINLYITFC